jgi:hypothetical protein
LEHASRGNVPEHVQLQFLLVGTDASPSGWSSGKVQSSNVCWPRRLRLDAPGLAGVARLYIRIDHLGLFAAEINDLSSG